MGKTTGIEWTDSTWNPIRGCTRVSEGCRNCYAERVAARFSGPGQAYEGLAVMGFPKPRTIASAQRRPRVPGHWTGDVRFIPERLEDPLRWRAPRKIFVNSMSDLFHPGVKDDWLADIFEVMARAPQHTYQILTKRPGRMLEVLVAGRAVAEDFTRAYGQPWAPRNWWFGVSVEDQETADERLPILAMCDAALRFVSYEPALGPVDLAPYLAPDLESSDGIIAEFSPALDWVICGGESGPGARPMHPDWARAVRDACSAAGIPFFFKQWGSFTADNWQFKPGQHFPKTSRLVTRHGLPCLGGGVAASDIWMHRATKKNASALLDGREYKEFPEVPS